MILLKGVSKMYSGLYAANNINMEIPDGCIFGIIGKSGAGKSTLLRIMSLLEKPDEGEIYYRGERLDTLPPDALILKRRKIGMIFQNFNLFSSRNAAANIAYPMEIAKWPKKKINDRVDELLHLVQIAEKRRARLRELSGGQKQRVAIARALAIHPNVLFCDEATSSLDPQTTRSILSLIKDLQQRLRITVVVVTHQMEVIRLICDHVAVMDGGRIIEIGKINEIFDNPKTQTAKDLINA